MPSKAKRNAGATVGVVRVSRELLRRAKVYAAQNDMTATAVFNEALEEYLKKRNA